MNIPIIEINEIGLASIIELHQSEFLKLFNDSDPDYVFKILLEDGSVQFWWFYAYQKGLFFKTMGDESKTWEEFLSTVREWKKNGFKDRKEYDEAQEYGISTKQEYDRYLNSDFYKTISTMYQRRYLY